MIDVAADDPVENADVVENSDPAFRSREPAVIYSDAKSWMSLVESYPD